MAQEGKIAFGFDGGVYGGAIDDIVQPPDFVESRNVRLSVTRGAPEKSPRVTNVVSLLSPDLKCSGVLPHPASGTACVLLDTPLRATDASTARVQRHDGQALGYGVTRPLKISAAGGTMPGRSSMPPSIAMATDGGRWVAQLKQRSVTSFGTGAFAGTLGLYVSYTDASGRVVLASQYVCDVAAGDYAAASLPHWCSITAHGTTGAIAWYREYAGPFASVLRARVLSLFGASLTVGSETTIESPTSACYSPAVYSLGGSDAWVAIPASSTVLRVDRLSSSLTLLGSVDYSTGGSLLDDASCSLWVHPSQVYAVAVAVAPARRVALEFNPGSLAISVANAASGPGAYAQCAAFGVASEDGTDDWFGWAYSVGNAPLPALSTTASGAVPRVRVELARRGSASSPTTLDIPHMRLASSYAGTDTSYLAPDVTGLSSGVVTRLAYLAMTPWYGPYTAETDRAYVTDPALMIGSVWVTSSGVPRVGWHARVAIDRIQSRVSGVPDGLTVPGFSFSGACMQVVGGKMAVGYLERSESSNLINEAGLYGRFVVFDLGAHQPPVAAVGSALTLSGGSIPLYWDGVELSEQMPLVRPVIHASTTTNATAALSATSYSLIAVVYWRDAQGALHRSAPSLPLVVNVALGARYPDILVTKPPTMHDDGACAAYIVRLYAASTAASASSVYRLMDAAPAASSVNGCWRFITPNGSNSTTTSSPALYSDGSAGAEVLPEPMPASQDVCVALDRVFAIDAESRSDVWYSKPLQPGVSPEFSGIFKVTFPAQAGQLIALAEIAGQLIAIGDAGVATLYGDGPDSSGNGGFGPPRIISRQGGVTREAVGRYPGGVIYLGSDGRWQKIDSQGVQGFAKAPQPTAAVRGWALLGNGSELAFWLDAEAHVYNYELDRWHTWTITRPETWTAMTVLASENDTSSTAWMCRAITYLGNTFYIPARLDGSLASTIDQAHWRTGWMIPGGDQQMDVEWQQVVIHAISGGSHGVTIEIDADFGDQTSVVTQTETWTSSQIAAIADSESGRYTLGIDVVGRKARSLRLRISETGASGTAFRPVSCTVYYAVLSKQARRPLKPDARR